MNISLSTSYNYPATVTNVGQLINKCHSPRSEANLPSSIKSIPRELSHKGPEIESTICSGSYFGGSAFADLQMQNIHLMTAKCAMKWHCG